MQFPILPTDLQIGFFFRLKNLRDLYFHEALKGTVGSSPIHEIDIQLAKLVNPLALQKLARFSLRGECIFPVPLLLISNPYLVGYYRLVLGFSQKEFYNKGPFGIFQSCEKKGKMSALATLHLPAFCSSLISSAEELLDGLDELNLSQIRDLQVLTIGPQFRGGKNNDIGKAATERVFGVLKELTKDHIVSSTISSIDLLNATGRKVTIQFASDPDIEIIEHLPSGKRGLISIEIKGGKDASNIHNRIGEAEKSHQKARKRGYFEFMTIINVEVDYDVLRNESPTTTHFFHLNKIADPVDLEHKKFRDTIVSILSIL